MKAWTCLPNLSANIFAQAAKRVANAWSLQAFSRKSPWLPHSARDVHGPSVEHSKKLCPVNGKSGRTKLELYSSCRISRTCREEHSQRKDWNGTLVCRHSHVLVFRVLNPELLHKCSKSSLA
ncbi:DDTdomain superfamily [Striga asiatica]|uniref:DDTdomain superfamily n=1 Tax=Striga asiatica TaxID=4170 RepID=A0A5A7PYS0_STRAF|nr:DDTdomain superfamily [Striga asiatica]